jgi:hypothetical protein
MLLKKKTAQTILNKAIGFILNTVIQFFHFYFFQFIDWQWSVFVIFSGREHVVESIFCQIISFSLTWQPKHMWSEVASFVFRIFLMSHVTFSPFFVIEYFKHSLNYMVLDLRTFGQRVLFLLEGELCLR